MANIGNAVSSEATYKIPSFTDDTHYFMTVSDPNDSNMRSNSLATAVSPNSRPAAQGGLIVVPTSGGVRQ